MKCVAICSLTMKCATLRGKSLGPRWGSLKVVIGDRAVRYNTDGRRCTAKKGGLGATNEKGQAVGEGFKRGRCQEEKL